MDHVTKNAKELYDEIRFGNFSYGKKRFKYDTLLREFLYQIKGGKLFDIGCGSGSYLDFYLEAGVKKDTITALDLAPRNVATLKARGVAAICGSVLDLPFNDNVSDFTIAQGVIHHTTDPFKAFSELARITKPNGYIYLNVYNKWHPYFYIAHKLTYPLRYIYYNWTKKIIDIVYPLSKIIFQPLAYLALGEFLDDKTGRAMFMDQVITPRAALFSKSMLVSYAKKRHCVIKKFHYNRYCLMLAVIMQVSRDKHYD